MNGYTEHTQNPQVISSVPISPDDLVMRSINLTREQDDALREFSYRYKVSRNDVIRAAVAAKLTEWEAGTDADFMRDLQYGVIGIDD